MKDSKIQAGDQTEKWYRERCHIREVVNTPAIGAFSLAETRVEPGVCTELHSLDVDEWYVIKSGTGRMEINGEPWFDVSPGDVVPIAAGLSQRIENSGDRDLRFTCVCLPRFRVDGYTPLE